MELRLILLFPDKGRRISSGPGVLPAGLGHQLGPEQNGRFGPIADRVLTMIADWLEQRIATD